MTVFKAPGVNNIIAEEIIKAATQENEFHQLLEQIWNEQIFLSEWKQAAIVPISKRTS